MLKKLSLCFGTALSSVALAHPGHDHSAWHAGFIHLLWIMPAIILVAFMAKKLLTKQQQKNK